MTGAIAGSSLETRQKRTLELADIYSPVVVRRTNGVKRLLSDIYSELLPADEGVKSNPNNQFLHSPYAVSRKAEREEQYVGLFNALERLSSIPDQLPSPPADAPLFNLADASETACKQADPATDPFSFTDTAEESANRSSEKRVIGGIQKILKGLASNHLITMLNRAIENKEFIGILSRCRPGSIELMSSGLLVRLYEIVLKSQRGIGNPIAESFRSNPDIWVGADVRKIYCIDSKSDQSKKAIIADFEKKPFFYSYATLQQFKVHIEQLCSGLCSSDQNR